jgi:hypothetical protein
VDGPARRSLGPLLGGLALALVVGGVAMAVALHGRTTAQRAVPTPTPGASSPRPSPSAGGLAPAPVGEGTTMAWDSTHLQVVAYDGATVATWDGVWHLHSTGSTGPSRLGVLVDDPPLHGALLITPGTSADTWLWDGSRWAPLAAGPFGDCMAPSSSVWDPVDNQVVVVLSDQCSNSHGLAPSETWVFDGQAWRDRGAAPAGVMWPALAWDAGANRAVMLQAASAVAAGLEEWAWTGRGWVSEGTPDSALPAPAQFAGAAFDGEAGGVVAVPTAAGPPLGYVVSGGRWSTLAATAFPGRIVAVTEDSTDHRIVVLGGTPLPVRGTPDARGGDEYLLTWNGHDWVGL